MIIYRPSERVTVRIGEVSIVISALTPSDKIRIASMVQAGGKSSSSEVISMAYETLRLSVKDIQAPGFEFSDGRPVSLDKKEDGTLSDDGLAVLLQVVDSGKIVSMAVQLAAHGIKDWEIEGVELVDPKRPEPEQKKTQD